MKQWWLATIFFLVESLPQHFVMRLIGDWQGWPEADSPKSAFDEPLFNELIAHWRTEGMGLIQYLLLAAYDRHTHQSRHEDDNESIFYDLYIEGQVVQPF